MYKVMKWDGVGGVGVRGGGVGVGGCGVGVGGCGRVWGGRVWGGCGRVWGGCGRVWEGVGWVWEGVGWVWNGGGAGTGTAHLMMHTNLPCKRTNSYALIGRKLQIITFIGHAIFT